MTAIYRTRRKTVAWQVAPPATGAHQRSNRRRHKVTSLPRNKKSVLSLVGCWRGLPNSPDYGGTPTDAVNQPHTPRRGFVRQGLPINSKIAASGIRPRRFVPIRSSRRGSAIEASMTMRRGDLAASCGSSARRGPPALLLLAAAFSPPTAVAQRTPQPVFTEVFAYDPAEPSQLLG